MRALLSAFTAVQRASACCAAAAPCGWLQVTTLFFYCNRPTVAALMRIGADVSDAVAAAGSRAPIDSSAAIGDMAQVCHHET